LRLGRIKRRRAPTPAALPQELPSSSQRPELYSDVKPNEAPYYHSPPTTITSSYAPGHNITSSGIAQTYSQQPYPQHQQILIHELGNTPVSYRQNPSFGSGSELGSGQHSPPPMGVFPMGPSYSPRESATGIVHGTRSKDGYFHEPEQGENERGGAYPQGQRMPRSRKG